MTKLTKLLTKPVLFFSDAMDKRKNLQKGNIGMIDEYKGANEMFSINKAAFRINLVVVDNIDNDNVFKRDVIKYQCRSLEKYASFDRVFYLSTSISSSNSLFMVYSSYEEFFENVVSRTSPRMEYFIFVSLNFFFLRETNIDFFINDNRNAINYVKNQMIGDTSLQSVFSGIYNDFRCNFTPVENYCCVSNNILEQNHGMLTNIGNLELYLFKFLPVINSSYLYGSNCEKSKIQFANLSGGYHEKFTWIQTVHGSERCPLAMTFNKLNSNTNGFVDFLDSITPHSSRLENEISLKIS